MCGIAGFFSNSEQYRPSTDLIAEILAAMEKRGPDDSGKWEQHESRILLLHRRLAIQDLSPAGAQPMHSHDGNLTIVFNGEIYNKDELRELAADYPYCGRSDTEVLLALYEKFGTEMPKLLRGMYAFAIWDEKRQGLFLARDPYGIKPLYIASTPHGIWFASQIKALSNVPGIDRIADPAGHTSYFMWGHIREPYTLYRGIRALRSGHSLWLQNGCPSHDVEFASLATELSGQIQSKSDVSLGGALRDSVRAHFLSDVPVSIFLSAGLDSSTVLALATDVFPAATLQCLTLGFDAYTGTENDETQEAALVAAHYGVSHSIQIIGKDDFAQESCRFLEAMDQPTVDGVNAYFIAKMAHTAGFKVALSGIGGDELFAGYPSFHEIPRLMNFLKNIPNSRKLGAGLRRLVEPFLRRFTSPKYAGTVEYGGSVEGAYLLRRALFMPWELPDLIDQDFAVEGLQTLFCSEFGERELRLISDLPARIQICYLESSRYLRNRLLRDADWAGMAHSVEIRTPLVDFQLLSRLARQLSSPNPPGKLDMAASPRRPLPDAILKRKKTGFSVPVREWLASSMGHSMERGLRSWAKYVYRSQWNQPAPHFKNVA